MKLKLKTILRTIFLMPVLPIIGAGAGDGAGVGNSNTDPANVGSTNQQDPQQGDQSPQNTTGQQTEKTFTQSELNVLLAKEKDQGRRAILKELGLSADDVKNAKDGLQKYKEYLESQKSDLQKAQDAAKEAEKARDSYAAQLEVSNQKLVALGAGCPAEKVDDVCVLARSKMSDTVTFEQAIEQVKQTYPDMFNQQPQSKGTGSNANPQNKGTGQQQGSVGQRLASLHKVTTENPYFKS